MTTPDIPTKKVVSVEILHLDEIGYGPEGKHTRREWRAECLVNFEAGAEAFLAWQQSWQVQAKQNVIEASFGVRHVFDDGSERDIFTGETKSHSLDFIKHIFRNDVDAEGYQFLYDIRFHYATFIGYAFFLECTFIGEVIFSGATFTDFADFVKNTFIKEVDFLETTFIGDAYFLENIFMGNANFWWSTFKGDAEFLESTFTREVTFFRAEFIGAANFSEITFTDVVDFFEVVFTDEVDFSAANFEKNASFLKAKFLNQSDFRNTNFKGEADFENAAFANVGHFEGATFNAPTSKIPSFRGVDMGSTLLEFSDDTHFTQADFSEEAIKSIAFLKHLSEQHGQIEQALNFNAMELRAKRLQVFERLREKTSHWLEMPFKCAFSIAWWAMRPTWFYGLLSDFGRSYMRPLLAYGVVFLFTFIFMLGFEIDFATEHKPQNCRYTHEVLSLVCDGKPPAIKPNDPAAGKEDDKLYLSGYRAAFEYANYHATGLVDFTGDSKLKDAITQRVFGEPIKPWWARIIGALLSIINTALLFLIALGLRNSYRLK